MKHEIILEIKKDRLDDLYFKIAAYEEVLRIIATGQRADGTYNYDRIGCQKLAAAVLIKHSNC